VKAEVSTIGVVRITGTYSEIGPLKANVVQMVGTQGVLRQTKDFIEISLETYVAMRKDTGGTVEETPDLDAVAEVKEQEHANHAASRDLVHQILEADRHVTGDDHWDEILDVHQGVAVNCMTVPGLLGLCLFDEQGTGKTITGLAAFDLLKKSGAVDALLITAPKTLLENWKDEAQKFLPFTPNIYIASGDREARYRALGSEYDIYLVTYENLIADIESLKSLARTKRLLLAMDESFFIKNPDAKRSMAAMELRGYCQRCFVLCGTPAPNKPSDLVHQFTMADNGYAFGGAATQRSQALEDFAAIESIIDSRGVYLRRTKKSVLPDLPEKDFQIVDLDMSPKQRALYDEAKKELILYLKSLDNKTFKRNLTTYFQKRNALLQICVDPSLIDPLYNEMPCKFAYLESALTNLIEIQSEKVVIWSVYTKTIDRIARSFARYNPARIDGKVVKVADRQLMVKRFQMDESCRVFVGNPAAAGAGITLHKAKTSIYLSYSNQAAHYMQSLDRTHRRGQTADSVNYLFLVAKDTIEVNEIKRLIEKQGRQSDLLGDPVAERIELADILNELEHG
jgi:SNF2 family DNA or RNA helicase